MPRTFKFSFPLPRQKSSSDTQPGASPQRMYGDEADDFPSCSPGVKAEEVLGTAEPSNLDLLEQPPRRPKKLRKHPSFITVTISDAGSESARDTDDVPLSARSMSDDRSYFRTSIARNQPSSPLRGQSFSTAVEEWNSNSNASSPRVRCSPSSSTLQSHYDPAKSPLSISQQTSASSTRDMALRKGGPPISSPLARNTLRRHSQGLPYQTAVQETADTGKKRPNQIDLSAVLRQPKQFDPPVHSPHLFARSAPQPSLLARTSRSISGKTRWLGWERRKTTQIDSSPYQPFKSESHPDGGLSWNEYASYANVPARNWFDNIHTHPSDEEGKPEPDTRPVPMHHPSTECRGPYSSISHDDTLGDLRVVSRKNSIGNYSQHSVQVQLRTGYQLGRNPGRLPRDGSSSQPFEIRSTPSTGSQRSLLSSQSNRNALSGMDLQNQSVLALSSSEDENEESVPSNDKARRHHIRESIDYADRGEEALVLSAERVKSLKPQPVVNVRSGRAPRSSISEVIPPVPSIPVRPMLSPRVSSMKWQEHRNIKAALDSYANGFDPDLDLSTTGSRTSQSSASSSQRRLNVRESRMMAVTPGEEKLLESMRRKRASIADDFSKRGSHHYSVRGSVTARPKTAGEEKRPRFYDASTSQSPPTVSEEILGSLNGTYTASVDDLTREIEYFPEVPAISVRLRGPTNQITSPKESPSLSFTASDLVPSTPASRRSPITPPPGMGHLDTYPATYAVSPSRSTDVAKNKHERKRTVSSTVVVLDGAEQRAQQLDEEDEIAGWAMNRW